jgi:hypothetical protein
VPQEENWLPNRFDQGGDVAGFVFDGVLLRDVRGSPASARQRVQRKASRQDWFDELLVRVVVAEPAEDEDQWRPGIVEVLSGALGLRGRSRPLGSAADRARSAVTWRIRSAIKKIASAHARLGRHLENAVRTGTFCVYMPETPINWTV